MNIFRLIIDNPRTAAMNMAIDEYLMNVQRRDDEIPTLRIYFWSGPAYSLGYFQDLEDFKGCTGPLLKGGVEVVRRLTGGGMVLHGEDLTFSLTLKDRSGLLPSDIKASYRRVSEAVFEAFKESYAGISYSSEKIAPSGRADGKRVCFENPSCHDLLLNGRKVLGSSQRRAGGVCLHQASLFLPEDREALIKKLVMGFECAWGIQFSLQALDRDELNQAARLMESRYNQTDWALYKQLKII